MSSTPSNTHYQNNKYQVTYECIDGYTVKSGRVKGYCSTYGTWTASFVCTADDNLSHNKPVSLAGSDATDVSPLTDGNMASCSIIPGVTEATFVIDLGKDTEVSDVSITLNDVVALKTPYMNVTVWRDGYPASSCYAGRWYLYSWYTINIACSYFPVGRYVSVHIYYSNVASLEICEIMVHGRPYTEALECQRRGWSSQDYKGNMNMTVAGIPCQRWDSQSPHAHSHTNISNFPDDNLQDAANYCRNPDRKSGQWCFTNDPDVEWQYCPIRVCDDMCLLGDKGSTYTGSMQKTSSGASCVTWSEADTPFKKTSHFRSWWPWSRKHYCRNPVHSQSRPWCYTSTDGSQYGLCDIPITCPTSSEVTRGRWVLGADQTVDELLPSTECLVWNNLFTSDGVFSGSPYSVSTPVSFVGNFAAEDVCVVEKVFNTSILCYNVTESGTVWKAGVLECVNCGSPPRVDNSNVSISSSLLDGNATYTCVTGYRHASGSSEVTCLKSGLWEVPDVVCKVNCGDPPSNNRTEFSSTNGFVNETVEYTCKPGYAHVSGSTVITCLDTGTWEEPTITCEVDCGDPSPVDHADIYVNSTWLGQTVNYSCHDGYAHTSGSDQVTCLDTVDCGDPSPVDHADIYVNLTWLGQTVNYSCHDGYAHTSGSDQVTCLDTGNWDVADMTCEVDCGNPPPVLNAGVTVSGTWQNNVAQYERRRRITVSRLMCRLCK
ncbi:uncharacterized protein LOC124142598 [Haliotis rufescens]|uniref:uncharacterized protein LOC124142598 n=1 Tax=Haliotis rufescens TaxID=6454 RepID=UPI00201F6838|nr:uncharacterized protein LOC124142598 [Haliotis rufescens]